MMQNKHIVNKTASSQRTGKGRKRKAPSRERTTQLGLLAFGSSRGWHVSIDEAVDEDERWYAQIEGPSVSLYFQLVDLSVLAKITDFLARRGMISQGPKNNRHPHANAELIIGYFGRAPVSLLWDTEHRDRCFLAIGPQSRSTLRLCFFTSDITMLQETLAQVHEDLAQERT